MLCLLCHPQELSDVEEDEFQKFMEKPISQSLEKAVHEAVDEVCLEEHAKGKHRLYPNRDCPHKECQYLTGLIGK